MIVVIMLSFIFFPTMWIVAGGTSSNIPYYIIINAGIIALLLVGLKRKIIFILFTMVVCVLIVIKYQRTDIAIKYNSRLIGYIDYLLVCLFSIVVLIAVLIDSYIEEHHKSEQYLATLEEKNKEIEAKTECWKETMPN